MTSTLTPPGPAGTDRGQRTLVVADLLPTEIVHARLARKTRRGVLCALAAVLVVLAGWYGVAAFQTHQARADLNQAQAHAALLQAKQQTYHEVISVQGQSATIDARLASLMRLDLQWAGLLAAVEQQVPSGIRLTKITGKLPYGADGQADTNDVQLPNTTGGSVVGTLTVSGTVTTDSKTLIASYVDALAKLSGLGDPLVQSFRIADRVLGFTARFDIGESALGGRYTPASRGN